LEIPNNHNTTLAAIAKTSLTIDKLQSGQQVLAQVVEQLPSKSTTILRIGNQLVQAKTDIPLTLGQTLEVTVEKSASEITLKTPYKSQPGNTLNSALRQLMPKQVAISEFQAPLLKTLGKLQQQSNTQGMQTTSLAASVTHLKRISNDIIQSLPVNKEIRSANGLKAAIQKSGILLEAKLLHALSEQKNLVNAKQLSTPTSTLTNLTGHQQSPIHTDLKANLNKLILLLKSWPKTLPGSPQTTYPNIAKQLTQKNSPMLPQATTTPPQNIEVQIKELLSKSEGALAKITLNQLASTENTSARQSWQLEIPLFSTQQAESVFVKIEKDKLTSKSTNQDEQPWTISIEMTPPKLGLIRSKLSLQNNKINSNFWAENESTRILIQQHVELLRKQFQRVNLDADSIQVQQGSGPIFQDIIPSNNILNEKA